MRYGYCGRILRVDLTEEIWWVETPGDLFYRTYMGGGSMGVYYLLRETPQGIDPLSSRNLLAFMTSVAAGAEAPGLSKHAVLAKSPLTGGVGESQSEGFWAAELKRAGFDGIVVMGKAVHPVYLLIRDGVVEIRRADHLWGSDTGAAIDRIKEENDDAGIRVAVIGRAGENLVRYASIINDYCFANQRTGLGAVMGAKNLKAVAVRGTADVPVRDPVRIKEIAADFQANFTQSPEGKVQYEYGTAFEAEELNRLGMAVSRNFTSNRFPYSDLATYAHRHGLIAGNLDCYGCAGGCKKMLRLAALPTEFDPRYGLFEYDAMAALGGICGVDDFHSVQRAYELCCRYSLDPVSTGVTIAFAMECFAAGIITAEDTGGIELTFGDGEVLLKAVEMIANRQGIGDVLAEGTRRAADRLGRNARRYAMEVKGKEIPPHEARVKVMLALGFAVSPNGPDYAVVEHDTDFDFEAPDIFLEAATPLGIHECLDTTYLGPEKVSLFCTLQKYWSFMEVINACIYMTAPVRYLRLGSLVELVSAITGWETSLWELMRAGERRINLMRVYNLREGFGREDDWLPERLFTPIADGPQRGRTLDRDTLRKAIDLYYEIMNWDPMGRPRPGKLDELGIGWAKAHLPSDLDGITNRG